MKKVFIIILAVVTALLLAGYFTYSRTIKPTDSNLTEKQLDNEQLDSITTVTDNLDTPWTIRTLPDDRLIVTERSGIVSIIGQDKQQIQVADVVETSEGGLLGLGIDPDFAANNFVYIYKTIGDSNVVERYTFQNNQLEERAEILSGIPAAANHNGGAIEFGPDKKLYITTGDAQVENLAQDRASLAGKILRINEDGTVPADNPFNNAVWSYGHRNPQGLAWDDQNRLWSTEHGPSGLQSGFDELNLIEKGGNYGWPLVRGNETQDGLIAPVEQSGAEETWAPAGLAYADGNLYFTGLRSRTLYKAAIDGSDVNLSRHLVSEYGRLRAITAQNDSLLVGTSNKDGRGNPQEGDDKLLQVPLNLL